MPSTLFMKNDWFVTSERALFNLMEYRVLDITLADIEMKNKNRESIKKSGKELNN